MEEKDQKNVDQIQHMLNAIIEGKSVSLEDYPNALEYKLSLIALIESEESKTLRLHQKK